MTWPEIVAIVWLVSIPFCLIGIYLDTGYLTVWELLAVFLLGPVLALGFFLIIIVILAEKADPWLSRILNYKIIDRRGK